MEQHAQEVRRGDRLPGAPYTSQVTVQVTSQLTVQVTVQVTSQLTSQLTVQVTSQLTVQVTSQLTVQVTSQLTSQLTVQVTSQSPGKPLSRLCPVWLTRDPGYSLKRRAWPVGATERPPRRTQRPSLAPPGAAEEGSALRPGLPTPTPLCGGPRSPVQLSPRPGLCGGPYGPIRALDPALRVRILQFSVSPPASDQEFLGNHTPG